MARLGGDEFVVVTENLRDAATAATVARKLMKCLERPFTLENHEVFISCSIGISLYPADGEDVTGLMKNADIALYLAKEEGRNNYQFYAHDLTHSALERFALEGNLRHALARDEFVLYYQPQINLSSGRLSGVEALIRWRHPEHGLLSPDKFLPLADELGMLGSIGEWVLSTACRQGRAWLEQGRPLKIAVNLSGYQIIREDIVSFVRNALHDNSLPPECLELEITEDFFIKEHEKNIQVLHDLKNLGVTLAIDDFGTGYSSLSYLQRFPIDKLKIDKTFIKDVPGNRDSASLTCAIIAIARALNLKVLAEGVETEAQREFLVREQCDEMQGFLCSQAVAAEELERAHFHC